MKKNRLISILLLFISIILSVGLSMCLYNHSRSIKETMMSDNEKQYISYANTQNMVRYVFLLSNDPTDIANNIYTVLQKSQYYKEYLNKVYTKPIVITTVPTDSDVTTAAPTVPITMGPTTMVPVSTTKSLTTSRPTTKAPTTKAPTTKAPTTKAPATNTNTDNEFYLLGQFLYTNPPCLGNKICLKNLPELNPFIRNDSKDQIVYTIVDDATFQAFIETLYVTDRPGPLIPHVSPLNSQNSITNTIQSSQNFQQDYLTAVSDPYTANLLELMEILYVSSIVPYSLYNVYMLEYNDVKNKYPFIFTDDDQSLCNMNPVLCNVNSYTMFVQLYNSAMQLHLSMNKLLDSSGNKIDSINFIKNNKDYSTTEMNNIKEHINKFMFMINDPVKLNDLVRGLEPSYIMFYNSLYYFYTKFNPETTNDA